MDTVQKVARNTVIIMAGNLIAGFIGMATAICMARYLGVDRFGALSFVLTYIGFFAIIIELGANQIILRDLSRALADAPRLIGNAIMMKLALALVTMVLSCAASVFFGNSFETKLLIYIASFSFLFNFGGVYVAVFRSKLEMVCPVAVDILMAVLKLILVIYLAYIRASLAWFMAAIVIVGVPGLLINLVISARMAKPDFTIDLSIWKRLLVESWPVVLTAVFIMVYTRVDQLLLFRIKGAQAVGLYSAAVRLVEVLGIVPSAFMVSLFPVMSGYFKTSANAFEKSYYLAFKYMMLFIMPIAVGTTLLSGEIIEFFYGSAFVTSSLALGILIWSEVWVFVGIVNTNILIVAGQQKADFFFTGISAIFNVILNLALIPKYGFVGAAIATTVSYGVIQFICYLYPRTRKYAIASYESMIKPFLAAVAMGAIICCLPWRAHIAIPVAVVVYGISIFLIKGISAEDVALMKTAWKGKELA